MNCSECQKNLHDYVSGKVPGGIKDDITNHITECTKCHSIFEIETLTNEFIIQETSKSPNPFLSTRIMAEIESLEEKNSRVFGFNIPGRISFQPTIISIAVAAAIFLGVTAGNAFGKTLENNEVPSELVYLNDAALESLDALVEY